MLLLLRALFSFGPLKTLIRRPSQGEQDEAPLDTRQDLPGTGLISAVKEHVRDAGGSTIFILNVARLLSVVALLALSVTSFILEQENESGLLGVASKGWGKKHKRKGSKHHGVHGLFTKREWIQLALCLAYVRLSRIYDFFIFLMPSDRCTRPSWHCSQSLRRPNELLSSALI